VVYMWVIFGLNNNMFGRSKEQPSEAYGESTPDTQVEELPSYSKKKVYQVGKVSGSLQLERLKESPMDIDVINERETLFDYDADSDTIRVWIPKSRAEENPEYWVLDANGIRTAEGKPVVPNMVSEKTDFKFDELLLVRNLFRRQAVHDEARENFRKNKDSN
jgi:hypothetical protein